jgi:hypothetical protein
LIPARIAGWQVQQQAAAGLSFDNNSGHLKARFADVIEMTRELSGLNIQQTETLFHTYSQFASIPNLPPKPSEDEQRIEAQIQDLLDRVGDATNADS